MIGNKKTIQEMNDELLDLGISADTSRYFGFFFNYLIYLLILSKKIFDNNW